MAPPLAEVTARAQSLTSAGELEAARDVLGGALDQSDTDPRRASPDLATAAALQARVLIALGDPHAAKLWAGFAHAAEERLHGARDERAVAAAATHAAVLSRIGHHGRAAQVYRDLLAALEAVDPPDSARVLAAEADLATAEHHSGQCTVARKRIKSAWTRHRDAYGDSAPAGIKMLARLAVMERECGRRTEAAEHVAMAQELCARYLPAGHPLVQQVDRLAGASATGKHVCGRVTGSDGPDPAADQTTYRPDAPPEPAPAEPEPDNRPTDPKGKLYQQPLYLSDVHQAPGDLSGRHARADTPLPMPGARIPEYTPEGRRVPTGSAPAGDLLPVPREKPESGSSRQPFILAAVLVAGVALAAAVVAATLPRGDETPPAAAPATATSAPAVTASGRPTPSPSGPTGAGGSDGAPTGLKLRDNRDAVVISWVYPKGADGPVLISGGRAGQERKVFQQMPPGSADYIAYGLNDRLDYCFSVAVVYSSDRVAATDPVCTDR